MKELIEKYRKSVYTLEARLYELDMQKIMGFERRDVFSKLEEHRAFLLDLETLQSKGKTKEDAEEIFENIIQYDYNGYTKESILKAIEYAQSRANKDGLVERFKRPTDDEVVSAAILFNEGKLEPEKLSDMVALVDFILDRLNAIEK